MQPDALKESIVLAKAPASASWSFAVAAKGLRAWQRKDGSIAFHRGGFDGPPALVMPKPYMSDARTDASSPYGKAWSPKVSQSMRWDGKAGLLHITVSADSKWLSDPKRVFPVVVDPTIVLQPLPENSQDTMIESDTPDSNYADSWRLSVGTTSAAKARALVKFPVDLPAGTKIASADLQMYYDQNFVGNTQNPTPDLTIEAHRATAPWDETTANWTNASDNVGELGNYQVTVDDGDVGTTSQKGAWPTATSTYATNGDYLYNKDSTSGDTYTWTPKLLEGGDFKVEAHYVAAAGQATGAPYTVTYNGGFAPYTVNQQSGTNGVWASLGTHPFVAGTTGKVALGDGPASTSTAVIADATRFTKDGSVVRPAGDQGSHWHSFPAKNIVQSWVDGTPNYGFVLKAADETQLGMGGPRYEGSVYAYNGETAQYPKLVITYGKPGVAVNEPTTIHANGADLSWPAYVDPTTSTKDDIVEYQVHRSIYQDFTPSAATLVSPVDKSTTSFSDTTATPTPADSADPYGNLYYYMVAVKTADGQVVPGPTQIVRLPKAGRTVKVYQASGDTTLSKAQSATNEDKLDGQAWLSVGNDSSVYGITHSVIKFPAMTDIPTSAKVVDGRVALWSAGMTGNAQATYDVHGLTPSDFDETTATWAKANSTTTWTTAGGDYTSTVAGSFSPITNDPARRTFPITSLAQGWVTTPTTNHGVLFRLANETTPGEHTTFLSSEADEPQLRPQLFVTYLDKTTDSTYYAPDTPTVMSSGGQYTVNVDVSDTVNRTLTKADNVLTYQWTLPDGTDVTGASQVQTPLPKDIVAGDTATVAAQVKPPVQPSDQENKRTDYVLRWNVLNKTTGQSLPTSDGIAPLDQSVAVEEPTSDQLGLEKFYQYAGKNTGAGASVMNNLYAGNAVWSYNPINNPGRGLSTFVRMAYNSQDTSASSMGFGWSLQASAPTRLGSPLDFHPNPNPTTVTMTDGDGTSHFFTWDATANGGAGEWKSPHGVHYYLQRQRVCDNKTEESRAWLMTRPDRTQFFYDCDGYLSAIVDKNLNEQDFTYTSRKSNNKPIKFLTYITDPAGRQSLTLDYYAKGDNYHYIDGSGNEVSDSNLTNPHIIDQVRSVSDISGRTIFFTYTDKGLMAKMVDGAGDSQAKTFTFTYDATQGNKNVKLVKATDPRLHDTNLAYYYPQTGDDPKFHWDLKTITDRLTHDTGFAYTDPDGPQGSTIQTVVTDPETRASTYLMDGFGRPTTMTNAKQQVTQLGWDTDNNVIRQEENNHAVSTWTYDPLTGYPLTQKDAEANKNDSAGTSFGYQSGLSGHFADLISKTSPEGRVYTFGYDQIGNLTSVTDPVGNATKTDGDYTTRSEYGTFGELSKVTDANGHATKYLDYDDNGYPQTITDPLNKSTLFVYDVRGEVKTVTDPFQHDTTQNYDVFGRPMDKTVPKNQAAGEFITTPAPDYDPNDNVVESRAPNGAVTTATYDDADQVTATFEPKDTSASPERKTAYEYDKAGNITKVTEPKGTLTTTKDTDYVTSYGYDEIYETTSMTTVKGPTTYGYDDVGNLATVIDPRKNATTATTDYTTKYTYDLNHRRKTVTDAAGNFTSTTYDHDGLTTETKDQNGTPTTITLDARGKPYQVKVPHSSGTDNITQYEYDQVGNQTKVITPRGVATSGVADDFVQQTNYDELNRVKEKLTPYDPGDARYNHPDATIYSYDDAGRLSKVSAPPSQGQAVRNDTTVDYFDNGWTKTSTDPWDIVTSYKYDDLGQQISRTLTSGGGSSSRTMGWTYYPDGKLKTRSDDGVPVGQQVVLVDDSDIQNAGSTGTAWTSTGAGAGFQGYDYATHAEGTDGNSFVWNLTIPEDGTYQVYAKYPDGVSGAATNASYTVRYDGGGTATKTVDQTGGGGTWVSLGSYSFKRDGTGQQVSLSDAANGTVAADAVKLVRDNTGEVDNEKADFAYAYDPNGNLTDITDNSSDAAIDGYAVTYSEMNSVATIQEKAAGTVKHTTTFGYNANNMLTSRTHDDESATYGYDVRDMVNKITDQDSPSDTAKVTTFTYTPRGQKDIQTKGNGNTVDADYFLDGSLQHQVEKKPNGTIVAEHTYSYDLNGNKTQDVATKMNADNHAAYLNTTTNWDYDPLDRIAQVTKTGDDSETETYVHDANNNVVSQTIKGTTTTFNYDRNRLLTTATGGATANYNYDPFGRLDTVTAAGQVIQRNTYDGFDHITEHQQQNSAGSLVSTKYTYDPLDPTASKTTDPGGANEKTTNYSYLALSDQILNENTAGKITKAYQYTPTGERLSQVKTNTDGSKEDAYYGYNDHTDVEDITDSNGDTKATYGYTAYGQNDDKESTGIDKPDPTDPTKEPYNAYRYEAKRWDANAGTYDMGFRDYDPGLNQFLNRDTYNGALDDQDLTTDPFTANRYAFGGGNPVGNVEQDGHEPCPSGKNCDYLYTGNPIYANYTGDSSPDVVLKGRKNPFDKKGHGAYNSEKWSLSGDLDATRALSLYGLIRDGACAQGWKLTCETWNHYLTGLAGGGGEDYKFDVDLLFKNKSFAQSVNSDLAKIRQKALAKCGQGTCDLTFDSKWQKVSFDGSDKDSFYAFGHGYFRLTGGYHVTRDGKGNKSITGGYKLQFYKDWNFDVGDSAHLPIPKLNASVPFDQFYGLHLMGYAHEYASYGAGDYWGG